MEKQKTTHYEHTPIGFLELIVASSMFLFLAFALMQARDFVSYILTTIANPLDSYLRLEYAWIGLLFFAVFVVVQIYCMYLIGRWLYHRFWLRRRIVQEHRRFDRIVTSEAINRLSDEQDTDTTTSRNAQLEEQQSIGEA